MAEDTLLALFVPGLKPGAELPATPPVVEPRGALQRRLQRAHALRDEYTSLRVPGPLDQLPPAVELQGLRTALQGRIRTERRQGDQDRLQAWKDWVKELWFSKQGAVCKRLKGDTFDPPLPFLVRPDGMPMANYGLALGEGGRMRDRVCMSDPCPMTVSCKA